MQFLGFQNLLNLAQVKTPLAEAAVLKRRLRRAGVRQMRCFCKITD